MKAPARAVAVSRLAEKVANIVLVPFFFRPPMGHGNIYAGTVPICIYPIKSVAAIFVAVDFTALMAVNWDNLPT